MTTQTGRQKTEAQTSPPTEILVGYDGSPDSMTAVDWAAAQAHRRGSPLRILTTAHYAGVPTPSMGGTIELSLDLAGLAEATAEEGRLRAAKTMGEAGVGVESRVSGAADALVEASERSALVVVGHSGHGRLRPVLLGSVTFAVTAHAHSPVAVIHGRTLVLPGPDSPVIVGTDGSPESDRAVAYAADEAARWGSPLEVVAVWLLPPAEPWSYSYTQPPSRHDMEQVLEHSAGDAARTAADIARLSHPDLEVRAHVVQGGPAEVLLERSAAAGLLVVGSRGLGGFDRLLMGSVSRAIVHRADCPVVVVRS